MRNTGTDASIKHGVYRAAVEGISEADAYLGDYTAKQQHPTTIRYVLIGLGVLVLVIVLAIALIWFKDHSTSTASTTSLNSSLLFFSFLYKRYGGIDVDVSRYNASQWDELSWPPAAAGTSWTFTWKYYMPSGIAATGNFFHIRSVQFGNTTGEFKYTITSLATSKQLMSYSTTVVMIGLGIFLALVFQLTLAVGGAPETCAFSSTTNSTSTAFRSAGSHFSCYYNHYAGTATHDLSRAFESGEISSTYHWQASGYLSAGGCPSNVSITDCYHLHLDASVGQEPIPGPAGLLQLLSREGTTGPVMYLDHGKDEIKFTDLANNGSASIAFSDFCDVTTQHKVEVTIGETNGKFKYTITNLATSKELMSYSVTEFEHPRNGSPAKADPTINMTFDNSTLFLKAIDVDFATGFAKPACWAIQPNLTVGTDVSLLGTLDTSLGNVQVASYVYFPDDFSAPLHGPGGNQYVIFLTGYAEIYFPNNTGTIPCPAGTNLVVVDNSTVSTGHYTNWTAGTSVVLVQFEDGIEPAHTSVSTSLCGF
ncbi:hypothetical protein MNV49_007120 [Pseudohyphozyma bogoriensis]|nr:hypothetical protein MNV49_007120 [Pseudohyphozyma bogoriensis]